MKYIELSLFSEEEDDVQRVSAPNDSKEQVPSVSRDYDLTNLFERLAKSSFRSRFRLSAKDKEYIASKGLTTIRQHAEDFVARRLAPAVIPNDGKQTPMRGHSPTCHGLLLSRMLQQMASYSRRQTIDNGRTAICRSCTYGMD